MITIGCHLSISKGFEHMGREALSIGASTFQFFSRNPRGGSCKAIEPADVQSFLKLADGGRNIRQILAHAPYTLNPCSKDAGLREFARNTMADDLQRLSILGECMYNFHPGSHTGQGIETGIKYIADMLNEIIAKDTTVTVLLETMAGKGSEIGSRFEELSDIIDRVEHKEKLGVCLDTCHIYDAGYDIVNEPDHVMQEFDKIIGIERLRAIHLNDSMYGFESHKDRHEKIGQGKIGLDAFKYFINMPQIHSLPFYLETPNELDGYAREIELLKNM